MNAADWGGCEALNAPPLSTIPAHMPTAIALINRMFERRPGGTPTPTGHWLEEFDLLQRNEAQRHEQLRGILTTREVNDQWRSTAPR